MFLENGKPLSPDISIKNLISYSKSKQRFLTQLILRAIYHHPVRSWGARPSPTSPVLAAQRHRPLIHYIHPCMTTNWCRIIGFPSSSSTLTIRPIQCKSNRANLATGVLFMSGLTADGQKTEPILVCMSPQSVTFDDTARFHSQIIISFILCECVPCTILVSITINWMTISSARMNRN